MRLLLQAYGLQGRLEKYIKKAMLERPEEKFVEISQRLERLAEDAWDLTEDGYAPTVSLPRPAND